MANYALCVMWLMYVKFLLAPCKSDVSEVLHCLDQ